MLHVAVATRAFRRYSTYTGATLAGIFTDAVTYVWIGQALLMTVALWGGGTTDDLADRIRSGDVAVDLYRPVNLLGWYLAGDLGRAAYHLLPRGPGTPAASLGGLVSIVLAVVVSFAMRFLFASTAFWLMDAQGPRMLSGV